MEGATGSQPRSSTWHEVVRDGISRLLRSSLDELRTYTLKLMGDPALLRRIGEAARRDGSRFSPAEWKRRMLVALLPGVRDLWDACRQPVLETEEASHSNSSEGPKDGLVSSTTFEPGDIDLPASGSHFSGRFDPATWRLVAPRPPVLRGGSLVVFVPGCTPLVESQASCRRPTISRL